VPRRILKVPEIPVMGTGKTDYVALQRIVDAE
jgi:acyl-[acyl-carrier-protein]-phospholipid O-acyltransferase/long-chain-fatty-acid--[acyl-carrier-protein] ligase